MSQAENSITNKEKPEASDDIALWLADEFTQVSDICCECFWPLVELTE